MSHTFYLTYLFEGEKRVLCHFKTNHTLPFVRDAIPMGVDVIGYTRKSIGIEMNGFKHYTIQLSSRFRELINFLEKELRMEDLKIIGSIKLKQRPKPHQEIVSELSVEQNS